ncbi:heme ABC exporter, ATP-binding protein CcmA [Bordetella bronchiseptica B18-5 (C3)]|uniref:heme ABC exporter ATP-binding protein CcmA n=1 Tax=Bordetella bronchiseptica TaxID=518 RepID=UPI000461734F|nr:heme ABC exporter ATP-binding protein CcmA [Bordetella bronchiseptica]KDB64218.1 heme ABC exporter, ATP-binding protein CcmA [Bordetella bronchiseptica B18-5 (C3)]KDD92211.1 heme ABC exporter, ATP-binding protein CcmA [Bordetella bronchiseptica MBORD762]
MQNAEAAPALLAAHGLVGRRGGRRPLDLNLRPGQLVHVRGANGSGKTSLLRTLAGLLRPRRGEVRWNGADIHADLPGYYLHMAYLGHDNGCSDALTARENLRYALHVAGAPRAEPELERALRDWGLAAGADAPAARLSQGQGRRLALARVMLSRKRLWLLDEPDAGLDAASLQRLHGMLDAHLAGGGAAVLASHRGGGAWAGCTQTLDLDEYAHAEVVGADCLA